MNDRVIGYKETEPYVLNLDENTAKALFAPPPEFHYEDLEREDPKAQRNNIILSNTLESRGIEHRFVKVSPTESYVVCNLYRVFYENSGFRVLDTSSNRPHIVNSDPEYADVPDVDSAVMLLSAEERKRDLSYDGVKFNRRKRKKQTGSEAVIDKLLKETPARKNVYMVFLCMKLETEALDGAEFKRLALKSLSDQGKAVFHKASKMLEEETITFPQFKNVLHGLF